MPNISRLCGSVAEMPAFYVLGISALCFLTAVGCEHERPKLVLQSHTQPIIAWRPGEQVQPSGSQAVGNFTVLNQGHSTANNCTITWWVPEFEKDSDGYAPKNRDFGGYAKAITGTHFDIPGGASHTEQLTSPEDYYIPLPVDMRSQARVQCENTSSAEEEVDLKVEKHPETAHATSRHEATSALFDAVTKSNIEAASSALKNGGDISYVDTILHRTMLEWAADQNDKKMVRWLLKNGADPNQRSTEGQITPLMRAADKGNSSIVTLLLLKGADPNLKSANGTTALMGAALMGHRDAVRILLQHCANKALRDDHGNSAFDWAARNGLKPQPEIAKLIDSTPTCSSGP